MLNLLSFTHARQEHTNERSGSCKSGSIFIRFSVKRHLTPLWHFYDFSIVYNSSNLLIILTYIFIFTYFFIHLLLYRDIEILINCCLVVVLRRRLATLVSVRSLLSQSRVRLEWWFQTRDTWLE